MHGDLDPVCESCCFLRVVQGFLDKPETHSITFFRERSEGIQGIDLSRLQVVRIAPNRSEQLCREGFFGVVLGLPGPDGKPRHDHRNSQTRNHPPSPKPPPPAQRTSHGLCEGLLCLCERWVPGIDPTEILGLVVEPWQPLALV